MRLITKRRDMFTPGDKNNLTAHIIALWATKKPIKISSMKRNLVINEENDGICVKQNGQLRRVQVKDAVFDQQTGKVKQLSWMWAK